jgi:hypothetical protein
MKKEEKNRTTSNTEKSQVSRRNFVKGAATLAAAAATVPLKPLLGGPGSIADASTIPYQSNQRTNDSYLYRRRVAQDNKIDVGVLPDNGDRARYSDFSALYSKALQHNGLGVANQASMLSLLNALEAESFDSLQSVIVGTPGGGPNSRLNGPAGSFAFDLEGLDSHAFTIPPPSPTVRSAQTATEEVEHYWAALLRDVPFIQYATDTTGLVQAAVDDLNSRSFLVGGGANQWPLPVTRQNLFRARVAATNDGNLKGPYISQFMVQPTNFGAQPLDQKINTFAPNQDFMVNFSSYQNIQNGGPSGNPIADLTRRFIRNGRDLTAYTRVDVLYQGYFVAFLLLAQLGAAPNAPPIVNPGNPYGRPGGPIPLSNTQKPFGTLGGPDAAGTLAEMATRALKASWCRKWIVDMRLRPEEYGALVEARRTGSTPVPQASAELHNDVLSSAVLPRILAKYGSHFLPQAFPEGSPTHPCYTGGHATVAGACCTAIKFFFDGSQKLRPLLQASGRDLVEPSSDGFSLQTYSGADANDIDINGELSKVAFNVCFGHGVHSGIHFRSSNYWGVLLGEAVALSVLKDRAKSYKEPFTINITKFDGTTATITNQNADSSLLADGPCITQ